MVGVTVMLIMLTTAAQSWTFRMRREMEQELIFRGEQYVKALSMYRNNNGGAFPVGDLKVLEQKNPMGFRYIRKLYTNPFDPNGRWQYLYLHPGGNGFINPCAVGPAIPGTLGASGGAGAGFPVGGSMPGGSFSPLPNAGTPSFGNRDRRGPQRGMRGQAGQFGLPGVGGSAVDPEAFKESGMAKMNLPIVGVVDCEVKESIGIYMMQTWLNQWAFTPLAQGQFVNTVPTAGGSNTNIAMPKGLGMKGAEVIRREDKRDATYSGDGRVDEINRRNDQLNRSRRNRGPDRSWNRNGDDDDGDGDKAGKGGKKPRRGASSSTSDGEEDDYDDEYDDEYDDDYDDDYDDEDDGGDDEDDGSSGSGGGLSASSP